MFGPKFMTLANPDSPCFLRADHWLGSGRLPVFSGGARITSVSLHFVSRFLLSPAPPWTPTPHWWGLQLASLQLQTPPCWRGSLSTSCQKIPSGSFQEISEYEGGHISQWRLKYKWGHGVDVFCLWPLTAKVLLWWRQLEWVRLYF